MRERTAEDTHEEAWLEGRKAQQLIRARIAALGVARRRCWRGPRLVHIADPQVIGRISCFCDRHRLQI
jgi:hypothetical protein